MAWRTLTLLAALAVAACSSSGPGSVLDGGPGREARASGDTGSAVTDMIPRTADLSFACSGGCCAGQTCCGTACATLANDPKNCGACGHVCPTTAPYCSVNTCSASMCACTGGATCCGPNCCAAGKRCCGTTPGLPGYGFCSVGICPG